MIEVIYKEETQEKDENRGVLSLPKNIRQIGMIHENYRIYVEDYVYTFLTKLAALAKKEEREGRIAVLTGDLQWEEGVTYLFIRGALLAQEAEASFDHIAFTERMWETIGTENKQYFPHQEIVGWFLVQQGLPLYATEVLTRTHIKYFGGEKLLFLMEPLEQEEAFFRYDNGFLIKQPGYYLYYEKNTQMQNYMVAKKEELDMDEIEQTEDEAVRSFRRIIKNKKKKKKTLEAESPFTQMLSYAATACLVAAVAAAGFRFYRNYRQLQNLTQQTSASGISELSDTFAEEEGDASSEDTTSTGNSLAETVSPAPSPAGSTQSRGSSSEDSAADIASTEKNISESYSTGSDLSGSSEAGKSLAKSSTSENTTSESSTSENAASGISISGRTSAGTTSTDNSSAGSSTVGNTILGKNLTGNTSSEEASANTDSSDKKLSIWNKNDETAQTSDTSASVKVTATPVPASSSAISYVVHPGDSLFQISLDHYGSIDRIADICALNGLSEEEIIYPGQIILLP